MHRALGENMQFGRDTSRPYKDTTLFCTPTSMPRPKIPIILLLNPTQ